MQITFDNNTQFENNPVSRTADCVSSIGSKVLGAEGRLGGSAEVNGQDLPCAKHSLFQAAAIIKRKERFSE